MQTFLPYKTFARCAEALDYKRLGKQRVEVKQILNALDGKSKGWTSHPATKMWSGYETALAQYGVAICDEWIRRGYADNLRQEFLDRFLEGHTLLEYPRWLGDARLHLSHQSNLLRKDRAHYQPIFGNIPDDLEYFWPTRQEN